MNKELKTIIDNAMKKALKVDGYNQTVIRCNDGSYSFTRSCEDCCPEWVGKKIGEVVLYWEKGMEKAKYVTTGRF